MKKALKPNIRMADAAVLALGNRVASALLNNTHFPSPSPDLFDLNSAIDAYSSSMAKAVQGSLKDIAQKNADKKTLVDLLCDECDYVNITAKGDLIALSSCGFDLSKDRQPKVLGIPDAKTERGIAGEMILFTPAVRGAFSYRHQYTTDPSATLWQEVVSTRATCKIAGLVPGTVYYFRIIAIGTKNQVTVSNVVSKMAA